LERRVADEDDDVGDSDARQSSAILERRGTERGDRQVVNRIWDHQFTVDFSVAADDCHCFIGVDYIF